LHQPIDMKRVLLLAALLAAPPVLGIAAAAPSASAAGDLGALGAAVRRAEGEVAPLHQRRATLATEAAALAGEIDARKRAPAGVRRDLELQRLLAASKAKTDELERVQAELRWREPALSELRRKLVLAIDAALERGAQAESSRLELERLRTATIAALASPATPLQIARDPAAATADPLDGPRELRGKADLLRDSGDKLRREATRIASRIDGVERRHHLRERAVAVDDDMFGEASSNRHVTRTTGALVTSHGNTNADRTSTGGAPASPATPTLTKQPTGGVPAPSTNPSQQGGPTAATTNNPPTDGVDKGNGGGGTFSGPNLATPPAARVAESTVLTNLIDPATLEELRRADVIDDVDRQTRALRRAQTELESLAKELDRRALVLEQRADALRKQK
jgi:hypothetical protein